MPDYTISSDSILAGSISATIEIRALYGGYVLKYVDEKSKRIELAFESYNALQKVLRELCTDWEKREK